MGAVAIPLMAGSAAFSAYNQYQSGQEQKNYYSYLAGTARQNAELAKASGEAEAKTVGAQEAQQLGALHEQGRDVVGAQKVALAAGGAGIGSKTAEQLVADTETKVNLDEQALRYNADLKMKNLRLNAQSAATNLENEAAGYRLAGRNAAKSANIGAFSTILGAGGSISKNWDLMRPSKATSGVK